MLPAWPWWPAVEATATMLPRRCCATISSAACLVQRNVPVRLTAIWRLQHSTGISSTPRPPRIPELFTRTSTPPYVWRTRAIIASTWPSSVTSHVMPRAWPPLRRIASAHWPALSAATSTHTTVAPSSARPSAMPPPMLGLVPVTIAIFWARRTGTPSTESAAAQPDQPREQGPGQRDQHDDARHDHRLLELALGHVVELEDRQRPVGAGAEPAAVAQFAACSHEREPS